MTAPMCVFASIAFFGLTAQAHDLTIQRVEAVFDDDGTFQLDLHTQRDAALLPLPSDVDPADALARMRSDLRGLDPEERERRIDNLRNHLRDNIQILFDGIPLDTAIRFPDRDIDGTRKLGRLHLMGPTVRFTGQRPLDARTFVFRASLLESVILSLRWRDEVEGEVRILESGRMSEPFVLERADRFLPWLQAFGRYTALGVEHILPRGLDHILFVLGLFLLSPRLRPLAWQVTAFTLAHSISLALSVFGVLSIPASVVEPLIAASIAIVALENVFTPQLGQRRILIVLAFGLLHGLGFASVLIDLGLPRGQLLTGLLGFNCGVELAQLTLLVGAWLAVGWLGSRPWYRVRVVIPGSILIASLGVYWMLARLGWP